MAAVSLFSMMQQPVVDQVFLIREHTHTHTTPNKTPLVE